MKPRFIVMAAVAAFSLLALAETPPKLPAPWVVTGDMAQNYTAGIDTADVDGARNAKFLRYVQGDAGGWSSLTQSVSAQNYAGKRVRFSARIKTRDVSGWAGLWMSVDSPDKYNVAFYNSADRPIKGSSAWQRRSVVLDVPASARAVSFGVINSGTGQVWLDALALDVVGKDVPVDVTPGAQPLPTQPTL